MGNITGLTLAERLRIGLSPGSKASRRSLGSVHFPIAEGRGLQNDLSVGFQRMAQQERMAFLIRFALLWHNLTVANRLELVGCFGGMISAHFADRFEVNVSGNGCHLFGRLVKSTFPDAHSRSKFLCLITDDDLELIDQLYEAATVVPATPQPV